MDTSRVKITAALGKIRRRMSVACLIVAVAAVAASAQTDRPRRLNVPREYPTIQAALNEAVGGDTVFVRRGVYRENVTLVDDVVLMGQNKRNTVIDGRRRGPVVVGAEGATITGFTIRNGTTGVVTRNTRPTIVGNIIKDNKGTGVHAFVALPNIINNVIYRNSWTGIFLEGTRGIQTSISNNVIMENGYSGIFGAGRTEVLVRNNVIVGNKQYGIFLVPDARRTRILGNNIYLNRVAYNDAADNPTVRTQNISADPEFVGAGFPWHNYAVHTGSPCRGRGDGGGDIGLSHDYMARDAQSLREAQEIRERGGGHDDD